MGGVQIYGRYPFDSKERDYARKFHNAEYTLPPEVPASDVCKDLLQRLLVADPERRISMEAIMAHAWFQETLPTGALLMNEHYLQRAPRVTEEVRVPSAHSLSADPFGGVILVRGNDLAVSHFHSYMTFSVHESVSLLCSTKPCSKPL